MVPKQVELLIHCYITLMEIVGQLKKLYEDASCNWRSTCRFANLGVAAVKPATSATHFQNRSPLHIAGKCWRCLKRRPFNKMSGFQMVNAGGGGGRLKHKWQIALFCTFNMSMSSLTSLVFTYCYREASPRAPAKRALTTTRQLQWAVRYFLKLLNKFWCIFWPIESLY